MKSEFDKAEKIYEEILQVNQSEAEAYWGLILCKYGIEYVEDPETHKRIPTCHRASYDAIAADDDYKSAMYYADSVQMEIYEAEAKKIDEIQKNIIAISQREEAYDVFICYKETDESGKRTIDSTIANDVYYQLTQEGFKVFYAAITLEDKLGKEYEPYIFSALNTAKVMLVVGTKPEYFNAVWVKNEWTRYLKIMKKDRSKILIPCYRDMDAYELPEEFAHLQAQDMAKIGFINDVVRGIKKIVDKEPKVHVVKEIVAAQSTIGGNNVEALLQRGHMAIEDEDWEAADGFLEDVLNQDAQCAEAYIGKLLVKYQKRSLEEWIDELKKDFQITEEELQACEPDEKHIEQVIKEYTRKYFLSSDWSESKIRNMYKYNFAYISHVSGVQKQKIVVNNQIKEEKYFMRAQQYAQRDFSTTLYKLLEKVNEEFDNTISELRILDETNIKGIKEGYKQHIAAVDEKVIALYQQAIDSCEDRYQKCIKRKINADSQEEYENLERIFHSLYDYKESEELRKECISECEKLKGIRREEAEKQRRELKNLQVREIRKDKSKKKIFIAICCFAIIIFIFVWEYVLGYSEGNVALDKKQYSIAKEEFKFFGRIPNITLRKLYENALDSVEREEYEDFYGYMTILEDTEYMEKKELNELLLKKISESLESKEDIDLANKLSEYCIGKYKKNQEKRMLEAYILCVRKSNNGYSRRKVISFPINDFLTDETQNEMREKLYLMGKNSIKYYSHGGDYNAQSKFYFELAGKDYKNVKTYFKLIEYISCGKNEVKKKGYDKEIRKFNIPEAEEYLQVVNGK